MLSLLVIVAIGFVLGMRHATDPDHVIAVSTIVTREQKIGKSALIGLAWGVGHTLTILAVGTMIVAFRVVLQPRAGLAMEMAVAVMLVVLGIRNLGGLAWWRKPQPATQASYHAHGDYVHTHRPHAHDPQATPLARVDRWLGALGGYRLARPLVVGIVHGLAGSAAIALLVLSTIPRLRWAVLYLGVFGVGTIAGMTLITVALASTFSFGRRRFARLDRHFQVAAGMISLAFGLFVAYQVGFVDGLLAGSVHWTPR